MSGIQSPAIWIPFLFVGCGLITLTVPAETGLQMPAAIGLFVISAFFISVIIHELGHAIGAILVRFQIINFIVGPLLIAAKTKGGYALLPNKNPLVWGGLVFALPATFDNLRRRLTVFIGGGLLASLFFGIVLAVWAASIWGKWHETIPDGISSTNIDLWGFGCFLGILGWVSLLLFIINVFPARTRTLASDGLKLLRLGKGGAIARRSASLIILGVLLTLRRRPSQLPEELVQDLLAVKDNSAEEADAHLIAYLTSLDRGDLEAANSFIEGMKLLYRRRKISLLSLSIMAYWIAFYEAIHRQDAAEARLWLDEANSRNRGEATLLYHMTNAAVLFLEEKTIWL